MSRESFNNAHSERNDYAQARESYEEANRNDGWSTAAKVAAGMVVFTTVVAGGVVLYKWYNKKGEEVVSKTPPANGIPAN